ncbi:MAG: hypothetical protein LC640_05190 [Frankia sp.]|nr:hypothetical protein [Frankia sp.]
MIGAVVALVALVVALVPMPGQTALATHPCSTADPTPTPTQSSSPSPLPSGWYSPSDPCGHMYRSPEPVAPPLRVTNADNGATVRLTSGQELQVELTPERAGDVWQGPDRAVWLLHLWHFSTSTDGTSASFDAQGVDPNYFPSRTDTKGPYVLDAYSDALCAHQAPACDYTPAHWSLTVYIDYSRNPAAGSSHACDASAMPPASAATSFNATPYSGGTVAIPLDGAVSVFERCESRRWQIPRSSDELFRDVASMSSGAVYGHFLGARPGESVIDYETFHACYAYPYQDAIACESIAPQFPVGYVNVRVAAVGSGCLNGPLQPSATTVPFGSRISLSGGTTAPGGGVEIYFRPGYESPFTRRRVLTADAAGNYVTSYLANNDYSYYAVAGSYTSPIGTTIVMPTISGPPRVARGSTVTLTVRAAPGASVVIYFRRYGETVFHGRRAGQTDASGTFTATYRADADYRYYAVHQRYVPDGRGGYTSDFRQSNTGLTQAR